MRHKLVFMYAMHWEGNYLHVGGTDDASQLEELVRKSLIDYLKTPNEDRKLLVKNLENAKTETTREVVQAQLDHHDTNMVIKDTLIGRLESTNFVWSILHEMQQDNWVYWETAMVMITPGTTLYYCVKYGGFVSNPKFIMLTDHERQLGVKF